MKDIKISFFSSPPGDMRIVTENNRLVELSFCETSQAKNTEALPSLHRTVHEQLLAYFRGSLQSFDLPLEPAGTVFQRRVWDLLQAIPFGQTLTYLQLARNLGDEKAVRAVGRANGQNPLAIVIPCHRVIGARGKLVGYAGGIERKKWLLRHEGTLLL